MIAFEERLSVGAMSYHFRFDPVRYPKGIRYFIRVCEGDRMLDYFEMKNTPNGWKVVPPCPSWAEQRESILSTLIVQVRSHRE